MNTPLLRAFVQEPAIQIVSHVPKPYRNPHTLKTVVYLPSQADKLQTSYLQRTQLTSWVRCLLGQYEAGK